MAKGASITANISPTSYRKVARYLDEEIRKVSKFSDALAKELAERAWSVADDEFANAQYDGVNDVVVSVQKKDSGDYYLDARGTAVAFIEYGAGVYYEGEYEGDPDSIPARFGGGIPGSYGPKGEEEQWWFEYRPGVETTAGGTRFEGRKLAPMVATEYKDPETGRWHTDWDWEYDENDERKTIPSGHTWVYTRGNPANSCMFRAFSYTIDDFDEIVDEVSDAEL